MKLYSCDSKKEKSIKEQKASRLSSLEKKAFLSKISLVCPLLFKEHSTSYYKV